MNIGKAIGGFLGFDPTPGFNLGYNRDYRPVIVGEGYNPRTGLQDSKPGQQGANNGANKSKGNGSGNKAPKNLPLASSGGGTGGGRAANAATLAQFDQGIGTINSAIGRLPGQLDIAEGNINRRYGVNLNELNSAKKSAENSFDTSQTQNQQNYRSDKNSIADSAASGLRGLMRTIGAAGAGGSSDALFNAPQAVADVASEQRSDAGGTFAQNEQSLDTNWNNFLNEDKNSRAKLTDWRTEQLDSTKAQTEATKQDLLTKLADLMGQKAAAAGGDYAGAAQPYLDQANSLAGKIDNLGKIDPTYTGKTPVYESPTLGSYMNDAVNTTIDPAANEGSSSPYFSALLQRNRKQMS